MSIHLSDTYGNLRSLLLKPSVPVTRRAVAFNANEGTGQPLFGKAGAFVIWKAVLQCALFHLTFHEYEQETTDNVFSLFVELCASNGADVAGLVEFLEKFLAYSSKNCYIKIGGLYSRTVVSFQSLR